MAWKAPLLDPVISMISFHGFFFDESDNSLKLSNNFTSKIHTSCPDEIFRIPLHDQWRVNPVFSTEESDLNFTSRPFRR